MQNTDSILQNTDSFLKNTELSLLEIFQSLQNESRSSTTTVEDTIRNIEENITVEQEEPITRTDNNGRLKGYFCSNVVFNVSHKVLTDLGISVLGKGLGFSPTPSFI